MQRLLVFVFSLLTVFGCRAQAPENRPEITKPAFDERLSTLLSFSVPLIGPEELAEQKTEVLIFDTRGPEEFEMSHIPGAEYLGYKEFDSAALENIDRDQPIVLYCSVGYRSEKIGEKLQQLGFTKVYNLYGSIFEWANQGYPLETVDGQTTTQVHTYNKKWSQWLTNPDYQKIW